MYEREAPQNGHTLEVEHTPPPLLWAQRDYLSELVAARHRNPEVLNLSTLVQLSALPPDHASKLKKQTKGALGEEVTIPLLDQFEARLLEVGTPLGVDPKDVDYDQSWRTCRRLRAELEQRKLEASGGRDLSKVDSYGYMKYTLGEHDLLEADGERALSAIIWSARSQLSLVHPELGLILRSGNYEQMTAEKILSELASEPRLRKLYQQYHEALDTLTLYNQRLALGYVATRGTGGARSEEVMVGAELGLRRAAELFDASTGLKFSTFATPWLRQSVDREVARVDLIQVPARVREQRSVLNGVIAELVSTLGREPTTEEITTHIEYLKGKTTTDDRAPKRYDSLTPELIKSLRYGPRVTQSLDTPIDPGDSASRTPGETAIVAMTDDTTGFEFQNALERIATRAGFTDHEHNALIMLIQHGLSHSDAELVKLFSAQAGLSTNGARLLIRRVRDKLRNIDEFNDLTRE